MINQLKTDYINIFADSDFIKRIYDDYEGEYTNIIVKEKYEKYPKISYPMITLSEIKNEDVNQYRDDSGENVTYLGYQVEINATQSQTHTAVENVNRLANIIDNYMKTDRYWVMRRIGNLSKAPMKNDNNVIIGYLRYECNLDIKTNTIYRRY